MKPAMKQMDERVIKPSVVLSAVTIVSIAVSVGYNVGFGQSFETASVSSRIVNVQADRLKPLLEVLSGEGLTAGGKTTHMRVDPPQNELAANAGSPTAPGEFDIDQLQKDLMLQGVFDGPFSNRFDPATQIAVRNYQRSKGMSETGEVSQALLDQLAFDRKIDSAVSFTASVTSAQAALRIRRVQVELDRLGYNPGPADGKMGLKTTSAIKRYQRRHGLNPTGLVDDQFLAAIGIAAQSAGY